MKAYTVSEEYEGHACVVFATNSATARREGASMLDLDWTEVDSCRRAPQFDDYCPGPVPPLVLIAAGWWFDCHHCGQRIEADTEESDEGEPLDPCEVGQSVYCTPECLARARFRRTARAQAVAAMCELVTTRFPAATVTRVHVYGTKLEKAESHLHGIRSSATFTLPGLNYPAHYNFGEAYMVSNVDVEAFDRLYGPPSQASVGP
ncbi:hypothetical protein ACQQ2N_12325 [Dokdonella sp. MW10]|uniref:hypothetical protein n=1 Tax=Dokdonella sp. MW10 TaxID=2992926 RepID=UPI003F7DBFAE